MPTPVADLRHAKVTSEEDLETSSARWVKLKKLTYLDPTSRHRTWESAIRATRPKTSEIDGVGIVALIRSGDASPTSFPPATSTRTPPRVVLQKQFRPAINKICVEFPAGLIDDGETAEECAIRELREETGYVGAVVGKDGGDGWMGLGNVMFNDPGFTNTNLRLVYLSIDPSNPRNRNPVPQVEDEEFIDTFTIPLTDLAKELQRLEREESCAIDARVGTVAEGLEMARWYLLGGEEKRQ